jgi:hypothetical protein
MLNLQDMLLEEKTLRKIAEFILISFEAEKSDTMKTFRYDMKFNSYEILGIPFYKQADGKLKDGVLGIVV